MQERRSYSNDRGTGMTLEQLRSAVKAGFSGNDPTNKLGLFGMSLTLQLQD